MIKRIGIGIVVVAVVLGLMIGNASAWWNNSWSKRAAIHINNTGGGAQTYYPVMINITYDSDMQTDFDDIRVVNETSGETVPYWIENKSDGEWCKLWFNASYIPGSSWCNDTYYLYYENPSANSESSVSDTFIREIDGLNASWHFDEGEGTTAYDTSGNDNDGTLTNMDSATDWIDGKYGKALDFDGSNDYVNCGNDESLNITDAITVEAWVKPEVSDSTFRPVVSKYQSSENQRSWWLGHYSGNWRFYISNDGSNTKFVQTSLSLNTWQHIVALFNPSSESGNDTFIYLNNVLKDSINTSYSSLYSNDVNVYIGEYNIGNGYNFNGTIDEVRIYNRGLTTEEISDLYNYYGYTTENYPGKVLVRKRIDPEPTASLGNEEWTCGYTITTDTVLNQDLECTGDGIIIGASDIVLDCNGHKITGDLDEGDYGINNSGGYDNITIKNCNILNFSHAIHFENSDNSKIEDVTINGNRSFQVTSSYGIYMKDCTHTDIEDVHIHHVGYDCIRFTGSGNGYNWVKNSSFNNYYHNGIAFHMSYDNATNCTFTDGCNGIEFFGTSEHNKITNSTISGMSNSGIMIEKYSDNKPSYNIITFCVIKNCAYGVKLCGGEYNRIYNNLFNNSNNFYSSGTIYENYWNTTKQAGERIYSNGNEIGGNFWTNPTGTGYSDTCSDSNDDGFCDEPYNLTEDGLNIDYLPLCFIIPDLTTLPATNIKKSSVTFNGHSSFTGVVWFEWGLKSGGFMFKTDTIEIDAVGNFSKDIKSPMLYGNKEYKYRAVGIASGTEEVIRANTEEFTMASVPEYENKNFSKYYKELDMENLTAQGLTAGIINVWIDKLGGFFWVILIAIPFLLMFITESNITIPSVIALAAGGALLKYLPEDWRQVAYFLLVVGIAGIMFSIFKSKKR